MIPACSVIRITRMVRRALAIAALLAAFGVPLAYAQESTTTDAPTTDATTTDGGTTSEQPPPPPVLIADGVTIGAVQVGGLTAAEAEPLVRAWFSRPFTFTLRGRTKSATPWWVGGSARVAAALANAQAALPGESVPLQVGVDGTRLRAFVARLARAWRTPAVNSVARLRGLRPYITRARAGYRVRRLETRMMIRRALAAHQRGPLSVPYRVLRPRITRSNFGAAIVIRRGSHRLYLYKGSQYWRTFGVAVGMPQYPTPLGSFSIVTKQRNPWWYPPDSAWAAGASPIPPGPGNPLGTRWMGLSRGGVGIHGTPDSASIGYSASHGCIRMRIPEAEWLFERVRVGTPVFIVSA
jgi:L,D-transpeptidase catalytic domain/Putative peptidoglycan binding domain